MAILNAHNATRMECSRAVIVLGMHRSGTSVLSRALISIGVDFGSSLINARPDNPKGFFEDKDVYALNTSFLREMGCQWYSLLTPGTYPLEAENSYKRQVATLLDEKFAGQPLWGLKDPRITRLFPLWENVLSELNIRSHFILANRNPLDVAKSLEKRNDIPKAHALALWALHQIDGLKAVIKNGGMIVDYDLMLAQPKTELRRLSKFIGKDTEVNESDAFLNGFLQQDLRHSHHDKLPRPGSQLLEDCLSLHSALLKLAQTAGPLAQGEIAEAKATLAQAQRNMDLQADWLHAIDAVYQKVENVRQDLRESNATAHRLRSELAWIEGKPAIKFAKKLKKFFSRA
jgi:hypothetical protein